MLFKPEQLAVPIAEFDRILDNVALTMGATAFPDHMPENDLHPEPAVLRDQIVALRRQFEDIDERLNALTRFVQSKLGYGMLANDNASRRS